MPVYSGSRIMWKARALRRQLHPAVATYRHRRVRVHDAALVSYPRSGSTWFSFMLAHLLLKADPSFDRAHRAVAELPDLKRALPLLPNRGRMLRSHEQWRREYDRAVYLIRDPRDVLLSYFRYRQWLREFSGSLDDFALLFARGAIDSFGRWDDHVESWLRAPRERVLVLQFEKLVADPGSQLERAAAFLEVPFSSDDIARAVDDNNLAKMRAKEERATEDHFRRSDQGVGRFIGRGQAGGWRDADADRAVELVVRTMRPTMTKMGYLMVDGKG